VESVRSGFVNFERQSESREQTHMKIADHRRREARASKSKELCSVEPRDARAEPFTLGMEGGVDRLAIWNFGHVGMSWSTGGAGTRCVMSCTGTRSFPGRQSRFTSRLCYRNCASASEMILIRSRSCIFHIPRADSSCLDEARGEELINRARKRAVLS